MTTNISRRSIAQGAAWSVPVITIGAAAPAIAASACVDTTRNVTLSMSTESTSKATNSIVWTNSGPDTLPAGTKLTYTITTAQKGGLGTLSNQVSDTSQLTQTITSGASTPLNGDTTTLVTTVTFTLTADVANGGTFTTPWTQKNTPTSTSTTQATPQTKGVMHPDGYGGGSTSSTTKGSGSDQSGTQTVTDNQGCTITLNLTAPAFG